MRFGNRAKTERRFFSLRQLSLCKIVAVGFLIGPAGSAFALSKEAAIENCRMKVGKPIVQACMRASGGAGNLEACRAKASPPVKACVLAALNAANDRGNARAQLGRLAESIADANKAMEVGRGAVSLNLMGRLMQFVALQYSAAGDPKKAFEVHQRQLRDVASRPGSQGYQFGANRQIR